MSAYERLVKEVAEQIRTQDTLTDDELANVIVTLICERTKTATTEMENMGEEWAFPFNVWSAMHAASALWPE